MFVTPGYAQETAPVEGASPEGQAHPVGEAHPAGDGQTPVEGASPTGEAHPIGEANPTGEVYPAGDAHTEVGADAHGGGVFPPFDPTYFPSQLLWLAITFGLFYPFLKRAVLPRIGGILEVRRDRIAQDLEQAARMKEEADAAVAAYEQELAEAKASANAIGQKARDEARVDAEAERKRVEAELDRQLDEAEARIAAIKARAMGEVGVIAEETADTIVRELVGGNVDRAEVAAAVKAVQG